jgi:hypothetical protein
MPRKKIEPWLKEEASAVVAIDSTRASKDWKALATEIQNVSTARSKRVKRAHNGRGVRVIDSTEEFDSTKESGRYLVQPPLVARDASLLEGSLKSRGFSGVVGCREPVTSLGLRPIVALGSGVTVRVQIEDAKNPKKPTCAWFDHALEELGHHVLESMNPNSSTLRQLDYLIAHFSAIPTFTPAYRLAITLCHTLESESV